MTEGAARAQLARRVENGSLEAARRRNRCTKKGEGGGGSDAARRERGRGSVRASGRWKNEGKEIFRASVSVSKRSVAAPASQPANQPATFYQQFLLPASPAFSILLCPAALIEAWKEGENRRAFSSVPMELNLTCIRTSGRNLRATTSYNVSLLFSSFLPRRKFFALSDSRVRESDFKVFLVQFETFSLSLSPPRS